VKVLKILEEEVQDIMLLDNSPSHPNTSNLCSQDCKIWYRAFKTLTTSLTQPTDQKAYICLLIRCCKLYLDAILRKFNTIPTPSTINIH